MAEINSERIGHTNDVKSNSNGRLTKKYNEKNEDINAVQYQMKPEHGRLALLFVMMDPDATAVEDNETRQVKDDVNDLEEMLQDNWGFEVMKPTVKVEHFKDKIYLKERIAYIFNQVININSQQLDCIFIGVFAAENARLNLTNLWDGLVTKDSNSPTRPKVFFLHEYTIKTDVKQGPQTDGAKPFFEGLQPSHTNFFLIHSFGINFVRKFVEVVKKTSSLELRDIMTICNSELKVETKRSYYESTLLHDLYMEKPASCTNSYKLDQDLKDKIDVFEDNHRMNVLKGKVLEGLRFILDNNNTDKGKLDEARSHYSDLCEDNHYPTYGHLFQYLSGMKHAFPFVKQILN